MSNSTRNTLLNVTTRLVPQDAVLGTPTFPCLHKWSTHYKLGGDAMLCLCVSKGHDTQTWLWVKFPNEPIADRHRLIRNPYWCLQYYWRLQLLLGEEHKDFEQLMPGCFLCRTSLDTTMSCTGSGHHLHYMSCADSCHLQYMSHRAITYSTSCTGSHHLQYRSCTDSHHLQCIMHSHWLQLFSDWLWYEIEMAYNQLESTSEQQINTTTRQYVAVRYLFK